MIRPAAILRAAAVGVATIGAAGCASSPWGDTAVEEERVFWGVSYERVHDAALAVVRELAPGSHRVGPGGAIRAEGEIGRCGEHAQCARRTPFGGASRLRTRLRLELTRRQTSTEVDVSAEYETVECRGLDARNCRRVAATSTGELEEEIVRRIRARVGS